MPELIKTRWYPESVLKAYYRFESGALTTDSSGNGHTLTAISDPAEDANGKFGGAVAFDGNDAYSATDHSDFKPTGNFTVGFWFKTSTTGAHQNIFSSYNYYLNTFSGFVSGITSENKIRLFSSKNTGNVAGTDYQQVTGGTTVTDGAWHFYVATWDGSYLRIYLDGASDATAVSWSNAPAYNATNYVRIGYSYDSTGGADAYLTGSLDDVFLLNGKALNAYEVLSIYRTISPAFLMNLASNWKNN